MNPKQLVEDFIQAFEAGDYDTCMSYFADGFEFSGPTPEPLSGAEWIGISRTLKMAFPDIKYNLMVAGGEVNQVHVTTQLAGTHTGDLNLTPMGFGVIPPTGKSFSNPKENGVVTVKGDKFTSYQIEPVEGGGLMGILSQIGVQPPGG